MTSIDKYIIIVIHHVATIKVTYRHLPALYTVAVHSDDASIGSVSIPRAIQQGHKPCKVVTSNYELH